MATWPPSLPQKPQPGSWNERAEENWIQSEPEIGAPVRRLNQTAAGSLASGDFMLTTAELADLLDWYEDDLLYGVRSYQWVHPIRGTLMWWRFEAPISYITEAPDAHRTSVSLRRLS